MTQLVEDLLALARSDAGAVEMPRAAIDLREVLTEVREEMANLADVAGIRVTAALGDRPAIISGNRQALHRLFMVLLDNALKYSRPGGDVILSITGDEGFISAGVEDSGEGIPEADLPHIFKRFYQADPSRSVGGHGLGLALAQSIAQAHGAEIDVRSTLGKGTVFRVSFREREGQTLTPAAGPTMAANTEALAGL
jgi:signal transduction histidine kinase